jgi:hypothetical protein
VSGLREVLWVARFTAADYLDDFVLVPSPRAPFKVGDLRALIAAGESALAAEREAGRDAMDARRYRALRDLFARSVGGAISVNEHRLVYEDEPHEFGAVHCQWYPDTPVGFCTLGGDNFDAMADAVVGHNTPEASRGEC